MATADYVFEIDWGRDGSYTGNDDVTSDTDGVDPVTIDKGRDVAAGVIGGVMSTQARMTLINTDYKYHPAYASSPLFGSLGPGRDTRIRTTSPSAVNLFRGNLYEYNVRPNPDERRVELVAYGGLNRLNDIEVTTAVYQGITTGTAIGYVLDAAGWPGGRRALDTGATVMPLWFCDRRNALNMLQELIDSEGPGAMLFEDGDGDIVFHDRHRRLTQTASKTSQVTFADTGSEPLYSTPHDYRPGWDRIINSVTIIPRKYDLSNIKRLWHSPTVNFIYIAAGSSYSFTALLDNPAAEFSEATVMSVDDFVLDKFLDIWDPYNVDHPDYLIYPYSSATADDLDVSYSASSGTLVTVTLENTNVSDDIIVRQLRIRGRTFAESDSLVSTSASDATSITQNGERTLLLNQVWMDDYTAQDLADVIVNDYKDPSAVIQFRVLNGASTRLTQQLTREINDLVTVTESGSGLNVDGWVERTEHEVWQAGKVHATTYTVVEQAASPLVAANEVLILNDATQGKLNTGKLGY